MSTPAKTDRLDIYCVAIGGTGMAPLACLLQRLGHRVRGADGPLYPPMSTLLEEAGIVPHVGYDPAHLEPAPELVIVGNAVPRHNIEAAAVDKRGLPRLSMPEAVARFLLEGRRPLVICGTHGKTTTTSFAAWVYSECGAEPGFLIGGVPKNLDHSFDLGRGDRFIIEGDEYNAAYFDRGPKFLHYRPQTLVLTSVEYDHADLYPSPQSLLDAYGELVRSLPADGLIVAAGDSPEVRRTVEAAPCRVVLYGLDSEGLDVRPLSGVESGAEGSRFQLADGAGGEVEIHLGVPGYHNVSNALAVWASALADGLDPCAVAAALSSFGGVRRRLEELGTARGVTVIDDFAHHPTAVGKSLEGIRLHYPGRRVVALFEPRSLTAGRHLFFDPYLEAFAFADRVLFAPVFHAERLGADRIDLRELCAALIERQTEASIGESIDALLEEALRLARPGDVLVTMSSGSFDGLPHRLLARLGHKNS